MLIFQSCNEAAYCITLLIIKCRAARWVRYSLATHRKTSTYALVYCNFHFLFSDHFTIFYFCPKINIYGNFPPIFLLQNIGITSLLVTSDTIYLTLNLEACLTNLFYKSVMGKKNSLFHFALLIIHLTWYCFRRQFESLHRYFIFQLYDGGKYLLVWHLILNERK